MDIKEADALLKQIFETRTLIQEQESMVKRNKEELKLHILMLYSL